MEAITINPALIEFGGPALAVGLALGALVAWAITWSIGRNRRRELEIRVKDQEALQAERDAAFDAASARLTQAFTDLSNQSLKSNSENFLRLAEQNLGVHQEKAKRELSEREQAIENLVKPIRDSLKQSQQQIAELEKARSEAYGSIRSQLETMQPLSEEELRQAITATDVESPSEQVAAHLKLRCAGG